MISNQSLIIYAQININESQELINVSEAVRNTRYSLFSESKSFIKVTQALRNESRFIKNRLKKLIIKSQTNRNNLSSDNAIIEKQNTAKSRLEANEKVTYTLNKITNEDANANQNMSNNTNVGLEMINKTKKALRINLTKHGTDAQANRKTSIVINNDIRLLKRATSEIEKCYMLSINELTIEHIIDNKYNQLQLVKTDS